MSRYRKTSPWQMIRDLFGNFLPNSRDNIKQISIKLIFMVLILAVVGSGVYFGNYYYHSAAEQKLISSQRKIFASNSIEEASQKLREQNSDYCGWIKMGEKLDNPIYRSKDNSFYLNNNALKKSSRNGSLTLDYRFSSEDKNRVIYGNSDENDAPFYCLQDLRSVNFYRENPNLSLWDDKGKTDYMIYAVFVLNSKKSQDGGNIYNIYRKDFHNDADFNSWVSEARIRSLIDTGVEVSPKDSIVTLVTSGDDFEGARLVVMARSFHENDKLSAQVNTAKANSNPKFPKKWYSDRNIKYPF